MDPADQVLITLSGTVPGLERTKPEVEEIGRREEMMRVLGLLRPQPAPVLGGRPGELYPTEPVLTGGRPEYLVKGLGPYTEEEFQRLPRNVRHMVEARFGEVAPKSLKAAKTPTQAQDVMKEVGLEDVPWYHPTPADIVAGIAGGLYLAKGATSLGREIAAELTLGGSELARAVKKPAAAVARKLAEEVKPPLRLLGEEGAIAPSFLFPFEHGKLITKAGKELMEKIPTPGFVKSVWGHKSLREMIIPRVDDLEKDARLAFLQYRTGRGRRQEAITDITDEIYKLDSENHDVALLWMTLDNPKDIANAVGTTVSELLQNYKPGIQAARKLRGQYSNWGSEAVAEGLLKKETYLKNLATYLPDMSWIKEYPHLFGPELVNLDRPVQGRAFRADLSRFMKNKGIIKRHKEEMLQIQDLKYLGPRSLYQIGRDLETAKLFHRLEEMPGYVFDDLKALRSHQKQYREAFERAGIDWQEGLKKIELDDKSFVRMTGKNTLSLEGKLLKRDAATALKDLADVPSNAIRLYERWFLGPWKFGKVILRFPTHCRNIMSNWILNDIGGLPFYRMDYYTKALAAMKKGEGNEMFKLAKDKGLLLATFREHELAVLERAWSEKEGFIGLLSKIVRPAADLYQAEEQWFKLAKFMYHMDHEVKAGLMDADDAIMAAMESTFDYGTSTAFHRGVRRTTTPFVTWPMKSIPYLAKMSAEHPLRVGKWPLMLHGMTQYASEKVLGSKEEWAELEKTLPRYWREKKWMLIPYRDERGRLQLLDLTYVLPWGDIAEIGSGALDYTMGNPVLTITSDLLKKQDHFGRKIYYDWEDDHIKFLKGAAHVYKQLAPSSFPGSWDWEKMQDVVMTEMGMKERGPRTLTPGQAIAYNLGLKITPMTREGIKSSLRSQKNRDLDELKGELARQTKSLKSFKRDEVIRKFRRKREELLEDYKRRGL